MKAEAEAEVEMGGDVGAAAASGLHRLPVLWRLFAPPIAMVYLYPAQLFSLESPSQLASMRW